MLEIAFKNEQARRNKLTSLHALLECLRVWHTPPPIR